MSDVQVKMINSVFDLTRQRDRVECLAASVALYRLFAALLMLAPDVNQRAALFFPISRPHETFITHVFAKDRGMSTVVRKEIFQPESFFTTFGVDFDDVKVWVGAHLLEDDH